MRAVFFGTPAIAVPALEALNGLAEVCAVVCQPDRPSGRGLEVKPPPVKARALELGLEVAQPTKIRTPEFAEWLRTRDADVALVLAYGRILPKAVLEAPRRGCMNLHASLLPRYRGAAPNHLGDRARRAGDGNLADADRRGLRHRPRVHPSRDTRSPRGRRPRRSPPTWPRSPRASSRSTGPRRRRRAPRRGRRTRPARHRLPCSRRSTGGSTGRHRRARCTTTRAG